MRTEFAILIIRKLLGAVLIVLGTDMLALGALSIWEWTGIIEPGNGIIGLSCLILGLKLRRNEP